MPAARGSNCLRCRASAADGDAAPGADRPAAGQLGQRGRLRRRRRRRRRYGRCPKWVGRGVSGGLLDVQYPGLPGLAKGNAFNTFNTRFGTSALFQKWSFGLTVPLLYKIGDVQVPTSTLGVTTEERAQIAGFGDISLEITRKLGITNAHMVTLTLNAPTGAHDAVRQGVVLPPQLQLGSGVLGAQRALRAHHGSRLGPHALRRQRQLRRLGEQRWRTSAAPAPPATSTLGYLLGPFVALAGRDPLGKFQHDREHDPDYGPDEQASLDRSDEDDPLLLITPNVGLEWSTDYLALLLSAAPTLSYNGYERVSFSLGLHLPLLSAWRSATASICVLGGGGFLGSHLVRPCCGR